MPNVARKGDTVNTGHGCDTVVEILEGDSTVLVEGKPVAVQSSPLEPHTIPNPSPPPACIPHPGQIVNAGSDTVIVGGKGIVGWATVQILAVSLQDLVQSLQDDQSCVIVIK